MTKFVKIILFLAVAAIAGFAFKEPLGAVWSQINDKYFPCSQAIEYSFGSFDEKFGISREEFKSAVEAAEKVWEEPVGRELFKYNEDADLKINLIYDTRQEATVKLQNLGLTVNDDKASYDKLKSTYTKAQSEYTKLKNKLESRINTFEKRKEVYEKEVLEWNEKGGATEEAYNRLNTEKEYLDKEVDEILKVQATLNTKADDINAMVVVINRLVSSLNIGVDKLNTIGEQLGGEFEEGTYESGPDGEKIDIYQFDNRSKLIRVLAHELGHALGLGHLENSKAIMYRLNNGVNEKLTEEDLVALKIHCEIE